MWWYKYIPNWVETEKLLFIFTRETFWKTNFKSKICSLQKFWEIPIGKKNQRENITQYCSSEMIPVSIIKGINTSRSICPNLHICIFTKQTCKLFTWAPSSPSVMAGFSDKFNSSFKTWTWNKNNIGLFETQMAWIFLSLSSRLVAFSTAYASRSGSNSLTPRRLSIHLM